jgi:UDP-N-acetylglucosamine 4,6-dehydratase
MKNYSLNKKFKKILITGGTGSFGNAALEYLRKYSNAKEITIFSRDELKQDELRKIYKNDKRIKYFIGDVRDKNSLDKATKNIDLIFHAAALKQVPSCEFFPDQAIKTNILGSENVILSSIDNKVKKLILLSTDKAVEPVNAMGMSKALMEKLAISYANIMDCKTVINIVRYGNVVASRGSVIPFLIKRIRNNQKTLITHKDMTRFLLTLEDAIKLVIIAANTGKSGEIFIKKAPSTNILFLTRSLYKFFKKKEDIQFIGIRDGEKIHEILISKNEMLNAIEKKYFFIISPHKKNMDYEKYFSKGKKILQLKDYNSSTNINLDYSFVKGIIKKIINEQK